MEGCGGGEEREEEEGNCNVVVEMRTQGNRD